MKSRKNNGFTLVEILIVVVILGILAAIVIPQFSDASTQAKENSLKSNLQTLRSQLSLYRIQHNDEMPDAAADLTGKTDADGSANASGLYGPYLQKIPANPFNDEDGIVFGAESGVAAAITAGENGWYFTTDTYEVIALDSTDHSAY